MESEITLQASSFFPNLFLEFCSLTHSVSSIILFHKFVQAFESLKIPVCSFGTWDTLKKVICLSISQALFPMLYMNLNVQNYKTHNLTDHQLAVYKFLPAIASRGDPYSSRSCYFTLRQPQAGPGRFISLILLRNLLINFPCATLATPISQDRLFLSVCSVCSMPQGSPPYCPHLLSPASLA